MKNLTDMIMIMNGINGMFTGYRSAASGFLYVLEPKCKKSNNVLAKI